ncbi:erythromycin esterase family protein [Thalassotalea litorea]|uniref:Erythromycin esterase family protein n=1 Tax=Thalassotalea litorea TaxID=2020715 RepID=A0A5R9IKN0_9GAMM|nr:erythromycin esterase family protein [Thalassotalea litorea]TLU65832.1 erythromycin esterase family protein [Thalassotalea litorea]
MAKWKFAINLVALLCLVSCDSSSVDADASVTAWVRDTSVAMETVEPGMPRDDLQAFGEMVGDARIVTLGEPTHGNREVFRLKHRLLEYLVREKGFTIFGIEAPFAESSDLNDYVLHGRGSAEEALASLTMWAWDTREVAAMLDWMRDYNADPENETKLKIFGFDMQTPERAARLALSYIDQNDAPEFALRMSEALGHLTVPYSDGDELGWRPWLEHDWNAEVLETAKALVERFDERQKAFVPRTGELEWDRMRQHARQLLWWVEASHNDGEHSVAVRDLTMFRHINWFMEQEGPAAKAVLWAHNSHFTTHNAKRWGDWESAGKHLRQHYGDDLVNVGMLFGEGQFTALNAKTVESLGVPGGSLGVFEVGPPTSEFFEGLMKSAMHDLTLLDLRRIPATGPVHEFFKVRRNTRHSGGGYDIDNPAAYFADYILPEAFDVIAYVRKSTPTAMVNIADYQAFSVNPELQNPDFETAGEDDSPTGWTLWSKARRWGFDARVTLETATSGQASGQICKGAGHMSPDVAGSLVQLVDASEWRGKSVIVKSSAKTTAEMNAGKSFLRVKLKLAPVSGAHEITETLIDTLDRYTIEGNKWSQYSIAVDIPESADSIMVGLFQVGEGCSWIDNVTLDISDD